MAVNLQTLAPSRGSTHPLQLIRGGAEALPGAKHVGSGFHDPSPLAVGQRTHSGWYVAELRPSPAPNT